MKRKFRVWVLVDCKGNEIARGRKKEVIKKSYFRYVYQHIFTDELYILNDEYC